MLKIFANKCTGIEILGSLSEGKKAPKKRTSALVRNVPSLTSVSEAFSVSLLVVLLGLIAYLQKGGNIY